MLHAALTAPSLESLSPRADRDRIDRILSRFLQQARRPFASNRHLEPLLDRTLGFVLRSGKRLRPRLCLATYRILSSQESERPPRPVWLAASSLEIFHAFMLVHDDLIDNSLMRRNEPALHEALRTDIEADESPLGARVGRDLGLLAGDLLCSLGMRLLAGSAMEPGVAGRVHRLVSDVLLETGLGEALDVLFETVPLGELTQEDVEEAYVRKTARYSVSGPLILGATLAKADRGIADALGVFGDRLGLGYQVQNDLDALSEPPDEREHPDLDAGKRTWVLWKAYQNADARKKAALDELLRSPVSAERRRDLFDLILNLGAIEAAEARLAELRREAVSALRHSALSGAQRQAFLAIASLFSTLPAAEPASVLDALSVTPAIPEKAAV